MNNACRTTVFPDKTTAKVTSRRLRLARRINTATEFCKECSGYHLVSSDGRIDETDRVVLFKIACGLRAHEIATDIQETESQVVHRVTALMAHFDALSRPNLVALAIFYGLIDVSPIALTDERKSHD